MIAESDFIKVCQYSVSKFKLKAFIDVLHIPSIGARETILLRLKTMTADSAVLRFRRSDKYLLPYVIPCRGALRV